MLYLSTGFLLLCTLKICFNLLLLHPCYNGYQQFFNHVKSFISTCFLLYLSTENFIITHLTKIQYRNIKYAYNIMFFNLLLLQLTFYIYMNIYEYVYMYVYVYIYVCVFECVCMCAYCKKKLLAFYSHIFRIF